MGKHSTLGWIAVLEAGVATGSGGCEAGATYDPRCDVNRDGEQIARELICVKGIFYRASPQDAGDSPSCQVGGGLAPPHQT